MALLRFLIRLIYFFIPHMFSTRNLNYPDAGFSVLCAFLYGLMIRFYLAHAPLALLIAT